MKVLVIFHCNEWKDYSSMRLIGVTDEWNFESAKRHIKANMGYTEQDWETYIYVEERELNVMF